MGTGILLMSKITVRELESMRKRAMASGKAIVVNESTGRGAGVLRIRALPTGRIAFYYRYTDSDARRDDYPIGTYSPDGRGGGYTLEDARSRVDELKILYRGGTRDVRRHLDAQERADAEALKRQEHERTRHSAGTLKALLQAYLDHLHADGKQSWNDAKSVLTLHVITAFPDLVEKRANEIEPSDLVIIFDRLTHTCNFRRTLGKARSYLHAAYNLAVRAPFTSTIPHEFRGFAVTSNPVTPLPTYIELSAPGERVLTQQELRTLLRELSNVDSMAARAIRACINLGGQRPTQLLRLSPKDIDQERGVLTVKDGKGKRVRERLHVLPLDPVEHIITKCLEVNKQGPFLFSSNGKAATNISTLDDLIKVISGATYHLKDLRRTCETELARLGVSRDIRAQILSHGLSGVQERHYDRYSYMDEKRDSLKQWNAYLHILETTDGTAPMPKK